MVKRLADLAEVDAARLQLWAFARAAADGGQSGTIWFGWTLPGLWLVFCSPMKLCNERLAPTLNGRRP
jgi:hypothetical protein